MLLNVVAKKRDASTDLLQRLHGNMKQHNVDFIGSDFNMSALSTVGDVFSDLGFSAPGKSFLWGLGALEEHYRECTGFLIVPKRPYEWRVDSHGSYKFDNAALGFGPCDLGYYPNLKGTLFLIQLTVISCIINSVFPFFNGTQARRAKILLTLFPQPVGSSMRLFYRKPVIMFRTSPISSLRSLATRTSLSCSTRILLSLTL